MIIGEKGSIKVGGQYMEKVQYCTSKIIQCLNLRFKSNPMTMAHIKAVQQITNT